MNATETDAMTFQDHEQAYIQNALESLLDEHGAGETGARLMDKQAASYRRDGGAKRLRLAAMHEELARLLRAVCPDCGEEVPVHMQEDGNRSCDSCYALMIDR